MVGVATAANPVQEVAPPAGSVVRTRNIRVTPTVRCHICHIAPDPEQGPRMANPGVVTIGSPGHALGGQHTRRGRRIKVIFYVANKVGVVVTQATPATFQHQVLGDRPPAGRVEEFQTHVGQKCPHVSDVIQEFDGPDRTPKVLKGFAYGLVLVQP